MLAAVMQPTYLGWCGYFGMLDRADIFVLLDTVQFSRQSWQQRNRVRIRDGREVWLTVPVHARLGTPIKEVQVAGDGWREKHWRTVKAAYQHTPGWARLAEMLAPNRYPFPMRLVDVNAELIRILVRELGIETTIVRASGLGSTRAGKIERLQDILRLVGADALLEPRAGSYLEDAPFPVEWFDYQHPVYSQGGQPFASHLSVVDLLAHHGPDSLGIIRSGLNT